MTRLGLKVLMAGIFIACGLMGCATIPGKKVEPTAGISYQIKEGLEIKKVTLYLKKDNGGVPYCWLDVAVKNNTQKEVKFKVTALIDDEPEIIAISRKPVAPQKEETLTFMTLSQSLPGRLSLAVGYEMGKD
ncbi:MAG: hypothetical protein HY882_06485 [Deltaproteobacteria bacterium]|nr:hypothetical protein [Deltaproteobacteria bacterium]